MILLEFENGLLLRSIIAYNETYYDNLSKDEKEGIINYLTLGRNVEITPPLSMSPIFHENDFSVEYPKPYYDSELHYKISKVQFKYIAIFMNIHLFISVLTLIMIRKRNKETV